MTIKQFFNKIMEIFINNRAEATLDDVTKTLSTLTGYEFIKKPLQQYAIQLGMLNSILNANIISEADHRQMKTFLKKKYNIKNSI